ncbi:btk-binding protein-related [Anaeramoeba flamelloides]|uniref:Btk-binding protein-related n=1 Tax=Anaeramoeba flamelloides TaxID=1746091 RepID=A0AAV8A6L2_9EUKA|nr:btk-binding protein-related [Anaeramoeba flamelloides]
MSSLYSVFGCGENSMRQMGFNDQKNTFTFLEKVSQFNIIQVASSYQQTCYLTNENSILELSANCKIENQTVHEFQDKIVSISAGTYHFLFLTNNGNVFSLGKAESGQLALGPDIKVATNPTIIKYFVDEKIMIKKVIASDFTSYFLSDKGVLYGSGQSTTICPTNPISKGNIMIPIIISKNVSNVFSGNECSGFYFIKDNQLYGGGNVHCTTKNINQRSRLLQPTYVPDNEIKQICVGWSSDTLLTDEGSVYTCGNGKNCGLNVSNKVNIFTHVKFLSKHLITDISQGQDHTLAISIEDKIFIWGSQNSNGQLGFESQKNLLIPKEVILKDFTQKFKLNIHCGLYNSYIYESPGLHANTEFYQLFEKAIKTDCCIHQAKTHKILIELRLGKPFDEVKKYLESNFSQENLDHFFKWVYDYGTMHTTVIKTIFTHFGILDKLKSQNTFQKDLYKLYLDEDTKDFSILVKEDMEETEGGDEDEDEDYEEIPVHLFMLLARSGLFREMISNVTENINKVQDYSNKSFETLEIFIKYLYTGKIDLTADDDPILICEELKDAKEYYQLNGTSNLDYEIKKIKRQFKIQNN